MRFLNIGSASTNIVANRVNADMAFVGATTTGKVAVTIEAKADERFANTVEQVVNAALERLIAKPESRALQRVADLAQSPFGARVDGHPSVSELRYQLLTGAAGSLALAWEHGASAAVLLVQEFITDQTRDELHQRNAEDRRRFQHRLGGTGSTRDTSGLSGPYNVPGRPLFAVAIPLFVGKVSFNRRGLGA